MGVLRARKSAASLNEWLGQGDMGLMATRAELYREKAEMCRRRAELVRNDLSEASRWRKLAEQWLKMADEALSKVAMPRRGPQRR